jgi:hypothetical protein
VILAQTGATLAGPFKICPFTLLEKYFISRVWLYFCEWMNSPTMIKLLSSFVLILCITGIVLPVSSSSVMWLPPAGFQRGTNFVHANLVLEINGLLQPSEGIREALILLPDPDPGFPITVPGTDIALISPPGRGVILVKMIIPYYEYPGIMMVYRDVTNVTQEHALTVSRKVGIDGKFIECDGFMHIEGKKSELWIENKSGTINFDLINRPNGLEDAPSITPTIEECERIALGYLESTGLMEREIESVMTLEGERGYYLGPNNTSTLISSCYQVIFSRDLNKTRVVGDSIRIEICGNGDIIELDKDWPPYAPYKEYPIITTEEAYEHFLGLDVVNMYEKVIGSMSRERYLKYGENTREMMPLTVNVTKIDLVYYGRDTHASGLLRPAYEFTYDFILDNRTEPGMMYLPAVPELGKLEEWLA